VTTELLFFVLIQNEYTAKRYLTGADFDIESIQQVGSSYWFGDEFGPYLLEVSSADGKVFFSDFAVSDPNLTSSTN
jgi:hypothetical protein